MEVTSSHEVIDLFETVDVGVARRRAVILAGECGLDEPRTGEVALIVTEAGTNVLRHATSGVLVLGKVCDGDRRGLMIAACDSGPGMDVARSLPDGVSRLGSAGAGLGAIARMSSRWDAYSRRPGGTVLTSLVWPRRHDPPPGQFQVAGISVPYPGERRNGDGWMAVVEDHVCTVLLSDGLGHGDPAADATATVIASFLARPGAPLTEILERVDGASHHTRGAAVAIARIDRRAATVTFAGMGNVAGWIATEDQQKLMLGQHGTVGQTIRKVRESVYPLPDHALVVLHSDGLESRWSLASYAGLVGHSLETIAAHLWRELGRSRDDATIAIVRPMEHQP
jgi:anti-sigma regulatory factor (Ser/Thr protein kinase)